MIADRQTEKRLRHQRLSAHQKSTRGLTSVLLQNSRRELLVIQSFSSHLIHRLPQANANCLCAVHTSMGDAMLYGCVSPLFVGLSFYIFNKSQVIVLGTQ